jgi:predicted enzyme related to lactoylglutathione lyase
VLKGLRTVVYPVQDMARAVEWYSGVVGHAPYFNEPFYAGFNVGGYELGLLPAGDEDAAAGPVSYWGTDDIEAELARLLVLGATPQSPAKDVGEGIKVAAVRDPSGNVIGVIENPHFKIG